MGNNHSYLLCTDLDRTLIPNGPQPESPAAAGIFKSLVADSSLTLAYVSGRDLQRVLKAIIDFGLPEPDFIVADVGSSIYERGEESWRLLSEWTKSMEQQWPMKNAQALAPLLGMFQHIRLQQSDQQGVFKLSYEIQPSSMVDDDFNMLNDRLSSLKESYYEQGMSFEHRCVLSIDETKDEALIDILPEAAGKLSAVLFLANSISVDVNNIYYSGDSGNDEDVLLSDISACVVANATPEFKQELREKMGVVAHPEALYFAEGTLHKSLNGNYCAGITEGFIHFFPQAKKWIDQELV